MVTKWFLPSNFLQFIFWLYMVLHSFWYKTMFGVAKCSQNLKTKIDLSKSLSDPYQFTRGQSLNFYSRWKSWLRTYSTLGPRTYSEYSREAKSILGLLHILGVLYWACSNHCASSWLFSDGFIKEVWRYIHSRVLSCQWPMTGIWFGVLCVYDHDSPWL